MTELNYCHAGACGCGAVRFEYHSHPPLGELEPRACQCEYCLPGNQRYLSEPEGLLRVSMRDQRWVYAHRFGTRTADFMHCARCNELVYVRCEIEGQHYALVVVNALESADQLLDPQPVDYDGEALAGRLDRRSSRWIGRLEVVEEGPMA